MSDDNKVIAEVRENFGKGFARRLRAAGKIPAVIYGHGTEPQHIALPGHQVGLIVRRANALLDLEIAGKDQLALVKDVQRDPVHQIIEHMDLLVVRKGEKIDVDVPITVVGEPFSGTVANLDATSVTVAVEATNIPEHIEVDIEGLEEGAQILAGELKMPSGAVLVSDEETLVVAVYVPIEEPEPEDEDAEESEAGTPDAPAAESDAAEESE